MISAERQQAITTEERLAQWRAEDAARGSISFACALCPWLSASLVGLLAHWRSEHEQRWTIRRSP